MPVIGTCTRSHTYVRPYMHAYASLRERLLEGVDLDGCSEGGRRAEVGRDRIGNGLRATDARIIGR